ncbi:hypothetical protein [Spiroplasma turonicum]|uniref:Lipoprotein n=1 Tax=Spiroplasma turonicum TaxID=216946 RepID=A0A0K1P868_9MOLU|nr:hypothetical protein [Spiroplasma turonicum]AKU80087.1 hypothetical protein STURON_00841 [Spiroplasma turonicum]ALX71088.1 hypothetical protein STURO_v1c08370 [Spiroplasma turonicum]
MKKFLSILSTSIIFTTPILSVTSCSNTGTITSNMNTLFNKAYEIIKNESIIETGFIDKNKNEYQQLVDSWFKKVVESNNFGGNKFTVDKTLKPTKNVFILIYVISEEQLYDDLLSCEIDIMFELNGEWFPLSKFNNTKNYTIDFITKSNTNT